MERAKATRNQTLTCLEDELLSFSRQLGRLVERAASVELQDRILHQDFFEVARFLPNAFADLVILDLPCNLAKNYHGHIFKDKANAEYSAYFSAILDGLLPTLKPNGSLYVCSDWKTSMLIAPLLDERLTVRNRITWEREKGRGAKSNWKNTRKISGSAPCQIQTIMSLMWMR